jgi:hypothetical protein
LALNEYHLISNWRVIGKIEDVYDVLNAGEATARWWPSAFPEVLEIQSGDEQGKDKVVRIESRGWLPYKLHWHSAMTETDRPHGFKIKVWGDFDGTGEWRLEQNGAWVDATFDWRIAVNKPLVRYFSPLLKPLFASNHRWAMAKGEESLRLELARRQAATDAERAALPPPPGAYEFPTLPLLAGGGALLAFLLWRRRGQSQDTLTKT